MTDKWDYLVSEEQLEDLIRNYCTDFTALARSGRYPPITGRDPEIDDCILILLQRGRKNCCFLAPAGVGKTAAVVGLAQRIVAEKVPDYLKNARVLEVDLARMASGTSSRAEFQARLMPFCKGVAERYHDPDRPRFILFLDEIHQIMPSCVGSSYAGMSDTVKPYLTAGDLLVLGATTLDEYRMYVESDPALDRRFQKVFLKIPNADETYQILKGLRPSHEKHHKVSVPDHLLYHIVKLTEEHMRKRNQPDKSIITLDASMAFHVREHGVGSTLSVESIYHMVGRETKLNKIALHDEKKLQEVIEHVDILEGRKEGTKQNKHSGPYDPSAKIKNIEIDEKFQKELEQEKSKDKELLEKSLKVEESLLGRKSDEEKKLLEIAARLEKKIEETVEKKVEEVAKDKA